MTDITPHADAVFGLRPMPDLDAATRPSLDALHAALDRQIDALVVVPVASTRHTASRDVINVVTAVMVETPDALAGDALQVAAETVADLDDVVNSERDIRAAALALAHAHRAEVARLRERIAELRGAA